MTIEEFLKKQYPEKFDVKDLMKEYYERYSGQHPEYEYQELLKKLKETETGDGDNVKKWYLYKTLDCDIDKRIRRFDCDSWNDTCELTSQIYLKLWRKECIFRGTSCNLSPDTMNSFARLFNRYMKETSFRKSYEKYDTEKTKISGALMDYAQNVGCIGNFTLVPRRYNVYRANHFGDDWGPSLRNLLCGTDKKIWLPESLCPTQYVNQFFLWDYVEIKNNTYAVRQCYYDTEPEQILPLLNRAIESRGRFMVKMLRIAVNESEEYRMLLSKLIENPPLFQDTEAATNFVDDFLEWGKKKNA